MNTLKKLIFGFALASFVLVSCEDDEVTPGGGNGGGGDSTTAQKTVNSNVTGNTTWSKDTVYVLEGKVYVTNGATLTIQPGTIIKGAEGTEDNAAVLVVTRGSKINAAGTANEPIIFTSILDDIKPGQTTGTTLNKDDNSKWGGVIVLGKAKISAKDGDTESSIEGLPSNQELGKYGGSDDADNSGVLTYISIRHGGVAIGQDNEINGLTLGGVGTGTKIENVEVIANLDDGIECFGGSVDIKNAIVAYQGDDAIDFDQNYSGTVSNVYVIHSTKNALEIDGPENATHTDGLFTIENGTFYADGASAIPATFKAGAQGTVRNSAFVNYGEEIEIEIAQDSISPDSNAIKTSAYTNYVNDGLLIITGNESDFATADAAIVAQLSKSSTGQPSAAAQTAVQDRFTTDNTINVSISLGANVSVFDAWSWTSVQGLIK